MKSLKTLTQSIIATLIERGQTITFAESCTGGQIAAEFTAIPGVSAVLDGAVVSYANRIKEQWLGVRNETLEHYGAVSAECVAEMLPGVLDLSGADCAIAVSGIAGPDGGTPDKPIGTVYIGIKTPNSESIFHNLFEGDRADVQRQSVEFAIEKMAKSLKK
jgi:nicotinamide-nucleotide amidase